MIAERSLSGHNPLSSNYDSGASSDRRIPLSAACRLLVIELNAGQTIPLSDSKNTRAYIALRCWEFLIRAEHCITIYQIVDNIHCTKVRNAAYYIGFPIPLATRVINLP